MILGSRIQKTSTPSTQVVGVFMFFFRQTLVLPYNRVSLLNEQKNMSVAHFLVAITVLLIPKHVCLIP